MTISIFLPVRKGSERVINKNTRPFAGCEGGLLELKLQQLLEVKNIEEIVVSTNDEKCIRIAETFREREKKIRIEYRPEELASSDTNLVDLIGYIPEIISSEAILWTHVTSPFITADIYNKSINIFQNLDKGNNDSLMSVNRFKNFLWDPGTKGIINNRSNIPWPRTQDLKELFEINSAVFLAPRYFYLKGERLGFKPFLFETDKIPSIDIDDEEEFLIAEAIYEKFYR